MENSYGTANGNGLIDNGYTNMRNIPYNSGPNSMLSWLELRVFYVRVSKCEIDDSTPEYLSLNLIPLNPETILEVNGVRTSINSDGAMVILRRDRLDRRSEEATYVSTNSVRMTRGIKFQVFDKDAAFLSGTIEFCDSNGFIGESRSHDHRWSMSCVSETALRTSFYKARQSMGPELPTLDVYVAGSFLHTPIILTKTLQLNLHKKHTSEGMLDSIPENEANESPDFHSGLPMQLLEYSDDKPENEDYGHLYFDTEYLEGEDGELSWFNAGVRVGVGIGLSICLGVGIGVGLLVQTYQGTTRNFRRRFL